MSLLCRLYRRSGSGPTACCLTPWQQDLQLIDLCKYSAGKGPICPRADPPSHRRLGALGRRDTGQDAASLQWHTNSPHTPLGRVCIAFYPVKAQQCSQGIHLHTAAHPTVIARNLVGVSVSSKGQKSAVRAACRHKHWLPSIFELRQLRELTVTAGSTWVRLPQAFCHLTHLERLTIQMQIEGGYDPCKPRYIHQICSRPCMHRDD